MKTSASGDGVHFLYRECGKMIHHEDTKNAECRIPNVESGSRLPSFGMFVVCTMVLFLAEGRAARAEDAPASQPVAAFADRVNLDRFRLIAVQNEGRLKTMDTLARETMTRITGTAFLPRPETMAGAAEKLDPVFAYLDLMLRPEAYRDVRLFYVKKKPVRQALLTAAGSEVDEAMRAAIYEDGRVSLAFVTLPAVRASIEQLDRDVMRTSKDVDMLQSAAGLSQSSTLQRILRIIPPAGATSVHDTWQDVSVLSAVAAHGVAGVDALAAGLGEHAEVLAGTWASLEAAWKSGDAAAAGAALNKLADILPASAPAVYPAHNKLALEHWYYKYHKMTWVWVFYFFAFILLLMAVVYRWPRARKVGVGLFALAFLLHTAACGIRWYLAGRIPNSNMFEAITAAAWFGAAVAIVLEIGPRLVRSRLAWRAAWIATALGLLVFLVSVPLVGASFSEWQQWGPIPTVGLIVHAIGVMLLIALVVAQRRGAGSGLMLIGSAVAGMVALMCGQFLSVELHSDIGTRMPVLNDLWLYIHTNMIIASYALIGMAFVTAGMYVVGQLLTKPTPTLWACMLLPAALMPAWTLFPEVTLIMVLPAWAPFLIVIAATLLCMVLRTVGGRLLAARSYAAWQGVPAAGMMSFTGGGTGAWSAGGALAGDTAGAPVSQADAAFEGGLARVLDGASMLLIELFFIMLWTGIIMGAIWADHSWGRPWGWDPKEVFALNTWIIFLVLVHVRLKVRDKALWTAVLVVIGTSVMLFNWIVVNFFITGLHSYA